MHLPAAALPGAPNLMLDPAAQAVAAQVFGRRSFASLGAGTSGILAPGGGGTGVGNAAGSTLTLGGALTLSGAFASVFTITGVTGVTFPTSGTLATTSQLPAGDNPGASIGLAAVNGVATSFLRSDGAPALSQGIAPTWSAQHKYNVAGGGTSSAVLLTSAAPSLGWQETDASADNGLWDMLANGEQLIGRAVNDANSVATAWIAVDRTGTTIDSVTIAGKLISNSAGNGLSVKEGANCKQGTATLVAGTVTVSNTSVTANSRIFISRSTAGGTLGHLSYTKIAATSFTVTSTSATETSSFDYAIFEPSP